MARTKKPTTSPPCDWTLDVDTCSYDTSCGEKFQLITDGPRENGMRFCCYCGFPLLARLTGETL